MEFCFWLQFCFCIFLLETLSYETTPPLAVGEMERHQAFIDSMIGAQKKETISFTLSIQTT
jgi:hypothetical protein